MIDGLGECEMDVHSENSDGNLAPFMNLRGGPMEGDGNLTHTPRQPMEGFMLFRW